VVSIKTLDYAGTNVEIFRQVRNLGEYSEKKKKKLGVGKEKFFCYEFIDFIYATHALKSSINGVIKQKHEFIAR
jgi:hypothetical protein